jgi:hypothetical protein
LAECAQAADAPLSAAADVTGVAAGASTAAAAAGGLEDDDGRNGDGVVKFNSAAPQPVQDKAAIINWKKTAVIGKIKSGSAPEAASETQAAAPPAASGAARLLAATATTEDTPEAGDLRDALQGKKRKPILMQQQAEKAERQLSNHLWLEQEGKQEQQQKQQQEQQQEQQTEQEQQQELPTALPSQAIRVPSQSRRTLRFKNCLQSRNAYTVAPAAVRNDAAAHGEDSEGRLGNATANEAGAEPTIKRQKVLADPHATSAGSAGGSGLKNSNPTGVPQVTLVPSSVRLVDMNSQGKGTHVNRITMPAVFVRQSFPELYEQGGGASMEVKLVIKVARRAPAAGAGAVGARVKAAGCSNQANNPWQSLPEAVAAREGTEDRSRGKAAGVGGEVEVEGGTGGGGRWRRWTWQGVEGRLRRRWVQEGADKGSSSLEELGSEVPAAAGAANSKEDMEVDLPEPEGNCSGATRALQAAGDAGAVAGSGKAQEQVHSAPEDAAVAPTVVLELSEPVKLGLIGAKSPTARLYALGQQADAFLGWELVALEVVSRVSSIKGEW